MKRVACTLRRSLHGASSVFTPGSFHLAPAVSSLRTFQSTAFNQHKELTDTNFPFDEQGCVMHVGVKAGDVANRILSVGDEARAARFAAGLFDTSDSTLENLKDNLHQKVSSSRGFTTHTGLFQGVPVSIIATGMGMAMMDFLVRETRAVTEGDMAIIRLGTCGGLQDDNPIGTVSVAKSSRALLRNFDTYNSADGTKESPHLLCHGAYTVTAPVMPSLTLQPMLYKNLQSASCPVVEGLNFTADGFYASQGRVDSNFDDRNEELMESLCAAYPDATTMEMETFQLLHLGMCANNVEGTPKVHTAAAAIVLAQRKTNKFLASAKLLETEMEAGRAVLKTLAEMPL